MRVKAWGAGFERDILERECHKAAFTRKEGRFDASGRQGGR